MDGESITENQGASCDRELAGIRAYTQRALEDLNIPGAAVAVIKDDDVIFQEGFGLRDMAKRLPVTPDTLFAIGSGTKSFTSLSVGTLVDDGKLDWDAPVASYLPEFKLHDKYASENATLRDLATHRVGLPRHDLVWYKASLSREEIVHRLAYLAFTKPFRTTFQYQNMMFVTLGCLVGEISGQGWEGFVRSRILEPLGMKRTNFSVVESEQDDDFAKPYKVVNQEIKETVFANIDAIGPAGSINSSAAEMAQWLRLHLGGGKFQGAQLISESNIKQMHTPHISIGPSPDERILFPSYGLGWFTEVYRGRQIVYHDGMIDGFTASVAMVPGEKIGVVVLCNQEHSFFPRAAANTIFDALLKLPSVDWNEVLKEQIVKLIAVVQQAAQQGDEDRIPDTKPSHELSAYVGEYQHPAYGTVSITSEGDQLYIGYHAFEKPLPLEHYHYDVFFFKFSEATFSEGVYNQQFKLQFSTNLRGNVTRLAIQFEPMLGPIEFERKTVTPPPNLLVWGKYVGQYDLAGTTVTVTMRGLTTLTVMVPGQPMYELVPISVAEFGIKGLPGFEIQFVLGESGVCSEIKFKQPNGMFILKRKSV